MEQQFHHHSSCLFIELNALLAAPVCSSIQLFFQRYLSVYKQVLLSCPHSFNGKIKRDVLVTKVKILKRIYEKSSQVSQPEIEIIGKKLSALGKNDQAIVNGQILGICSDISEYKQKACRQNKSSLSELMADILYELVTILRRHLVIKEFLAIKNSQQQIEQGQKKFLSQKQLLKTNIIPINHSDKNIRENQDQKLLTQITNHINKRSINQVLDKYIQQKQQTALGSYETCRICLQNIKIEKLQLHIAYCSKTHIYLNKIDQLKDNRQKAIDQIRQQVHLIDKQLEGQDESQLKYNKSKIYTMILRNFNNQGQQRRIHRNQTELQGKTKNKGSNIFLKNYIDEFMEVYGEDQLLQNFNNINSQLKMLEKKVQKLNRDFIHQENEDNENVSFKSSLNSEILTIGVKSIKTKKSLFRRAISIVESSKSSKKSIFEPEQLQKFKSIKIPARDSFDEELKEEENYPNTAKSMKEFEFRGTSSEADSITSLDFEFLKLLGKGAYGNVYLARRKKTKDLYAIKTIKISNDWGKQELKLLENQHEIFKTISSEYLVRAPFSFTEGLCHFFVMQFVPGGDLAKILENQVYFEEEIAKIYLAEIIMAIEALHESGIVHRDLKPENLVINEEGHLKLTDFGLSQIRINDKISKAHFEGQQSQGNLASENTQEFKTKRPIIEKEVGAKILGTPDYIAPEIINNISIHNQSIDWWSFGVIAYEIMIGCRPFSANKLEEVIDNIRSNNIEWPPIGDSEGMISFHAADLIQRLLDPDFNERLGAKGAEQVKNHQFFKDILWQLLKDKRGPIIPEVEPLQHLCVLKGNRQLKSEIKCLIQNKQKSNVKLQKFVRYDLLVNETYESAEKNLEPYRSELKQLRKIAFNLQDEKENHHSQRSVHFSEWENQQHSIVIDEENITEQPKDINDEVVYLTYFDSEALVGQEE